MRELVCSPLEQAQYEPQMHRRKGEDHCRPHGHGKSLTARHGQSSLLVQWLGLCASTAGGHQFDPWSRN